MLFIRHMFMSKIDGRLPAIDCLRGLAIIGVVGFHYLYRWAPPRSPMDYYGFDETYSFFSFGWAGVQLFFVVSGLVIAITIGRFRTAEDFAVKRVARIYPAFVVASILIFGVELVFDPLDLRVSFLQFMLNFTIAAQTFGIPPVDGAFWSLAVEIKFYAWTALLFAILRDRYWVGLLILGLAGGVLIHMVPAVAFKLLIAPYMPSFLIGIALWHGVIRRDTRNFYLCLIVALTLYATQINFIAHPTGPAWAPHAFVLGGSLLLGVTLRLAPSLTLSPLAWIGRISYSIYLIHQDLGVSVIHVLKQQGASDFLAVCLTVLAVVFVASLIFRWVEQPLEGMLFREYKRRFGGG